jgi:hypothetical protein
MSDRPRYEPESRQSRPAAQRKWSTIVVREDADAVVRSHESLASARWHRDEAWNASRCVSLLHGMVMPSRTAHRIQVQSLRRAASSTCQRIVVELPAGSVLGDTLGGDVDHDAVANGRRSSVKWGWELMRSHSTAPSASTTRPFQRVGAVFRRLRGVGGLVPFR